MDNNSGVRLVAGIMGNNFAAVKRESKSFTDVRQSKRLFHCMWSLDFFRFPFYEHAATVEIELPTLTFPGKSSCIMLYYCRTCLYRHSG